MCLIIVRSQDVHPTAKHYPFTFFRPTQVYEEFGFVTFTGTSGKGNGLSALQFMSVAYISRMILTMKIGKKAVSYTHLTLPTNREV